MTAIKTSLSQQITPRLCRVSSRRDNNSIVLQCFKERAFQTSKTQAGDADSKQGLPNKRDRAQAEPWLILDCLLLFLALLKSVGSWIMWAASSTDMIHCSPHTHTTFDMWRAAFLLAWGMRVACCYWLMQLHELKSWPTTRHNRPLHTEAVTNKPHANAKYLLFIKNIWIDLHVQKGNHQDPFDPRQHLSALNACLSFQQKAFSQFDVLLLWKVGGSRATEVRLLR